MMDRAPFFVDRGPQSAAHLPKSNKIAILKIFVYIY